MRCPIFSPAFFPFGLPYFLPYVLPPSPPYLLRRFLPYVLAFFHPCCPIYVLPMFFPTFFPQNIFYPFSSLCPSLYSRICSLLFPSIFCLWFVPNVIPSCCSWFCSLFPFHFVSLFSPIFLLGFSPLSCPACSSLHSSVCSSASGDAPIFKAKCSAGVTWSGEGCRPNQNEVGEMNAALRKIALKATVNQGQMWWSSWFSKICFNMFQQSSTGAVPRLQHQQSTASAGPLGGHPASPFRARNRPSKCSKPCTRAQRATLSLQL